MLKKLWFQGMLLFASLFLVKGAFAVEEAPSTVRAKYVEPSATRLLKPGEKIGDLYTRNVKQDYILQRLTKRTYWFQRQYYSTIFYVGDQGVLVFDPLQGSEKQLREAIASVTQLPVTAVVYSHDHADHIGDSTPFIEGIKKDWGMPRVIASKATADKMDFLDSSFLRPTEIVDWPNGSFTFEGMKVDFHGFQHAAHTDDHGIWYLAQEKTVHLPDHINPDQLPFFRFGGSENYVYYPINLEKLAGLDWVYLSSGHGNIGSKADIEFYQTFLQDLEKAVREAMATTPWGTGVDPEKVNAHTAFFNAWHKAVAKKATDALRPKYGLYYGFEDATPSNAEMVSEALFSYQ